MGLTRIVHLARGTDGKWAPDVDANGAAVKAPDAGESFGPFALAVHDGNLHLLRSAWLTKQNPDDFLGRGEQEREYRLWHAVFDGTAWSEGTLLHATHVSRYPPALASYDGRLHAVYSTPENALRHTTWTAKDGWADARDVEGRESEEMPALLVFKDGPTGAEREALLLVNRGVEKQYVPPAPPEPPTPPTLDDVADRGTTVSSEYHRDHSEGCWSRVTHRLSLTPATLKNGTRAAIATWEARAEYYWGSGYYPENHSGYTPRIRSGTLRLKKKGDTGARIHKDFSGSFDPDGRYRHDVLVPDLDPGEYELYLGAMNTTKEGGYWYGSRTVVETNDTPLKDPGLWTRIDDFSRATVTTTI
ncbi:hypothetical protein [Embleya sp. NPDC001921]